MLVQSGGAAQIPEPPHDSPGHGGLRVDTQSLSELSTYTDYSRPLMKFLEELPPEESVVLVGHSLGGACLSLATEKFPKKINAAIFVTASIPEPTLGAKDTDDHVIRNTT